MCVSVKVETDIDALLHGAGSSTLLNKVTLQLCLHLPRLFSIQRLPNFPSTRVQQPVTYAAGQRSGLPRLAPRSQDQPIPIPIPNPCVNMHCAALHSVFSCRRDLARLLPISPASACCAALPPSPAPVMYIAPAREEEGEKWKEQAAERMVLIVGAKALAPTPR